MRLLESGVGSVRTRSGGSGGGPSQVMPQAGRKKPGHMKLRVEVGRPGLTRSSTDEVKSRRANPYAEQAGPGRRKVLEDVVKPAVT